MLESEAAEKLQTTELKSIRRKSYLDVLRILACFLVIFNHLPGYDLYKSVGGPMQWVYMFVAMFTRVNVPVFFMISGALLLPREEPLAVVLKHRVARIAAVLLIFGTVLYIAYTPWSGSIMEWLKGVVTGNITYAYWYLYAYLGMLVMLPFLRKVAKWFGTQEFIFLLILHFLFCSLWPVLDFFSYRLTGINLPLSVDFSIPLVQTKAFFYPLIGYYLDYVLQVENLKGKHIVLLSAAAFIGLFITCGITYMEGANNMDFSENFVDLFTWLTSIAVFVNIKYLFVTKKRPLSRQCSSLLTTVSSLTFGIYLLDPLLQHWIYWPYLHTLLASAVPVILASVCWCLLSMFLGGFITFLLKKSPKLL